MKITHLNNEGNANMVDVSNKNETKREAKAQAIVQMSKEAYDVLKSGYAKKGDILSVAQVAGIMAAKNTSNIIPLCHPLNLTHINIEYSFFDDTFELTITSTVSLTGKTGVEMEALTSASVAALTVYDMLKAIDKKIVIKEVKLLEKTGGKSGTFRSDS